MSDTGHISCDEVRDLLVADGSGRGDGDQARLRQHLSHCPECRRYDQLVQRLREAVTEGGDAPQPDPRRLASLHAAVRAQRPATSWWTIGAKWPAATQSIRRFQAARFAVYLPCTISKAVWWKPAPCGGPPCVRIGWLG